MADPLDLGPLDAGLRKLLDVTSGTHLGPSVLRDGEELAAAWQEQVQSDGLIRTGAYRSDVRARLERSSAGGLLVTVGTDRPYAGFLEYGTRHMEGRHTGRTAFLRAADQVVEQVARDIAAALE